MNGAWGEWELRRIPLSGERKRNTQHINKWQEMLQKGRQIFRYLEIEKLCHDFQSEIIT